MGKMELTIPFSQSTTCVSSSLAFPHSSVLADGEDGWVLALQTGKDRVFWRSSEKKGLVFWRTKG
ncbi:uncharacterized protein G2W53_008170 [Senna tora]|uniref:Uncharacterized protein n=1 Tax=Senna tora TaxID=362788 RepID=A0A834X8A3_9FABA|nr:uncharacterized protein G2W53_008170 [Senna tora]